MELFGKHRVTLDRLRALAIQCHALDVSAYHLFSDSTHTDTAGKTKATFEELFTSKLLTLAIALRTKFYQGMDHQATVRYVSPCGLLYKYKNGLEESVDFSMKDVCDKIIHADSVSRVLESGDAKPPTTLRGKHEGSDWELSISVSLFSEAVLEWLQDAEKNLTTKHR